MSVRCVRALARVVMIGVLAGVPCVAVADEMSPQPSATTSVSPETASEFSNTPLAASSAEPFGGAVREPAGGSLAGKWNAAKIELRIDMDIIAACRSEPGLCESEAARRVIGIVEQAQKREGRALIGEINRAVNLAVSAVSDKVQYGVDDRWASPLMTFTSGRGDCEDYALAKYAALRMAGFSVDDLRFLIVRLPQSQAVHAVLSVRHEGRWLVLDNRRFAMLDVVHLDAAPLFALRDSDTRKPPVALAYNNSAIGDAPYLM